MKSCMITWFLYDFEFKHLGRITKFRSDIWWNVLNDGMSDVVGIQIWHMSGIQEKLSWFEFKVGGVRNLEFTCWIWNNWKSNVGICLLCLNGGMNCWVRQSGSNVVIFQNVSNVGILQIDSYIENVKLLRILNSDNGSNFENRLFGMNWIWAFLCEIG